MMKKLALAAATAATLCNLPVARAADMETTVWTVECTSSGQTRKIRVTAEDREAARDLVNKESASSGFCAPYNLVIVKVVAEK